MDNAFGEGKKTLNKARERVLRLLTYRDRSKQEVKEYLGKKGYNDEIKDLIIVEMASYGYIDDHKFALKFSNYRKRSGFGPIKTRHDLMLKGIDREVIDAALDQTFNPEEDRAMIVSLVNKRIKSGINIDKSRFYREVSFLKRRGFLDCDIITALKDVFPKFDD